MGFFFGWRRFVTVPHCQCCTPGLGWHMAARLTGRPCIARVVGSSVKLVVTPPSMLGVIYRCDTGRIDETQAAVLPAHITTHMTHRKKMGIPVAFCASWELFSIYPPRAEYRATGSWEVRVSWAVCNFLYGWWEVQTHYTVWSHCKTNNTWNAWGILTSYIPPSLLLSEFCTFHFSFIMACIIILIGYRSFLSICCMCTDFLNLN